MESEIRYKPSFSTIFIKLQGGDRVIAEADAMASKDVNIGMDTHWAGGFFNGIKRIFGGGESAFVNTFYVESGSEGELVLTQNAPGDVECIELTGNEMYFQPGAFIACTEGVEVDVRWAGIKSFIAREGLFKLVLSGHGKVWFGCYGGLVEKQIQGEYLIDTSHLVAYDPELSINLQLSGSLVQSFTSGEGFLTRIEGNGKVYMQSRSIPGLAGWINPRLR